MALSFGRSTARAEPVDYGLPRVLVNDLLTAGAKRADQWRLACFGALMLAGLVAADNARLRLTSRIAVYVARADEFGRVGTPVRIEPLTRPDDLQVRQALADWTRRVHTVLPADAQDEQAREVTRAFRMVSGQAAEDLNAWFKANDPRVLGRTIKRRVDIRSVIREPTSSTWVIEWTETDTPIGPGAAPLVTSYKAVLPVAIVPPATPADAEDNPLGVRVTSYAWTRITESTPAAAQTAGAR